MGFLYNFIEDIRACMPMSLLHDDNSSSINKYPSGTKGDPLICVSFYPEDIEKDKADKKA